MVYVGCRMNVRYCRSVAVTVLHLCFELSSCWPCDVLVGMSECWHVEVEAGDGGASEAGEWVEAKGRRAEEEREGLLPVVTIIHVSRWPSEYDDALSILTVPVVLAVSSLPSWLVMPVGYHLGYTCSCHFQSFWWNVRWYCESEKLSQVLLLLFSFVWVPFNILYYFCLCCL